MTDASGGPPFAAERRSGANHSGRSRVGRDDGTIVGLLAGSALAGAYLHAGLNAVAVLAWLAALALSSLYVWHAIRLARRAGDLAEATAQPAFLSGPVAFRGLIWGVAGGMLFIEPGADATVLIVLALTWATVAGAGVAGDDIRLTLFVVAPALGPAALFLLSRPDVVSQAAGALLLAFGVTLVRQGGSAHGAAGRPCDLVGGLLRLAASDPLTGGWNRRRFREFLDAEFYRSRRYGHALSVAKLAVDNFDAIRSAHGRAAANQCLREFAGRIVCGVRQSDVWARHDSGCFLLMLPDTGSEEAVAICERLRRAARRIHAGQAGADGTIPRLAISVGIAGCTPEDGTVDALLGRLDDALRKARGRTKNTVVFADSPSAELQVIAAE